MLQSVARGPIYSILDPIMLITGIQSVSEPRGELVVANCEILRDFEDFSEFFRVFPRISERPVQTYVPVVVWKIGLYHVRELVKKSYTAMRVFVMSPVFLLCGDSEHDTDEPKIAISDGF